MKKEIGGERLGSGEKMNVDLHNYSRSTHNQDKIFRSSMACGTLVPFWTQIALNGDTHDIDLDTLVRTFPTNGPLYGSFKLQLDIFSVPIRLYNGLLHLNPTGIGMKMGNVKIPKASLKAKNISRDDLTPIEYQQFDQSCLWAYVGQRGLGQEKNGGAIVNRDVMALFPLAYYDIHKNYYANKQEGIGAILTVDKDSVVQNIPTYVYAYTGNNLSDTFERQEMQSGTTWIPTQGVDTLVIMIPEGTKAGDLNLYVKVLGNTYYEQYMDIFDIFEAYGTVDISDPKKIICRCRPSYEYPRMEFRQWQNVNADKDGDLKIETYPLENIDLMREDILRATGTSPFFINDKTRAPYGLICEALTDGTSLNYFSQNGLALKTYQSDIFNNWLSTEWIDGKDGIAELTKINTDNGLYMDELNLMQKVYNYLNRVAVSGGSYEDWQEAVWSEQAIRRAESPMYMGGMSTEIVFNEVVSTADTSTPGAGDQPLGSLAGKGTQSGKKKGGSVTIKTKEPSILIGIASITPRIDYSQGNKWWTSLDTLDDLHKPALDGIGFQELITEQMMWADTQVDSVTGEVTTFSAGKQPAWLNYMTDYNETYGNFAHPHREMFMTLNRRYEMDESLQHIKDLTTYIDPSKYNYIFANTDLKAQNFWVQIAVDCTTRRKISAKIIPNL